MSAASTRPSISRRIGNETYHFSAEGFFQINHDLLEPLIAAAIGDAKGKTASRSLLWRWLVHASARTAI